VCFAELDENADVTVAPRRSPPVPEAEPQVLPA
jgi:hypothetical protein